MQSPSSISTPLARLAPVLLFALAAVGQRGYAASEMLRDVPPQAACLADSARAMQNVRLLYQNASSLYLRRAPLLWMIPLWERKVYPGCQSGTSGTYEWRRDGNTLRFEVVDDACLARASLFAGQPWVARP